MPAEIPVPVRVVQIDVLWCPRGADAERFSKKAFKGAPDAVAHEVLDHIQHNFLYQTVIKHPHRAEATRFWNFPLATIKTALAYVVDHLSYEANALIEVRIGYYELTIKSSFQPTSSTEPADSSTAAAPKIFKAMTAKGYPAPMFEIVQNSASMLIRLPAHALVQTPFPQGVVNGQP